MKYKLRIPDIYNATDRYLKLMLQTSERNVTDI